METRGVAGLGLIAPNLAPTVGFTTNSFNSLSPQTQFTFDADPPLSHNQVNPGINICSSLNTPTPTNETRSRLNVIQSLNPALDPGLAGQPSPQFTPPTLFERYGIPSQNPATSSIMRGFVALTGIFPNVPPARILFSVLTLNPSSEIQPEISTDLAPARAPPVDAGAEIPVEEPQIQEATVFSAGDYIEWPDLFEET